MIRTSRRIPRWFTVSVIALWLLGVFVPSTVVAQHGPGRHGTGFARPQESPGPQEGPAYDTKTEAIFTGTVTDVKSGGPGESR